MSPAERLMVVVAKEPLVKALNVLTAVLVIVGALNWGLVGMARFNLVSAIFGESALASIVYILVGISAVYQVVHMFATQKPQLATA